MLWQLKHALFFFSLVACVKVDNHNKKHLNITLRV